MSYEAIDLKKYRIIDLSYEIVPGEWRTTGEYVHGTPWETFDVRAVEVTEFTSYGARMHWVKGESHSGTHAEAPYKYFQAGKDVGTMPLESYMGEAAVCNFSEKGALEPITPEDLEAAGVREGDIVLAYGPETEDSELPYLSDQALQWLIDRKVKMVGIKNILISHPDRGMAGINENEAKLFGAGIAMTDGLTNLSKIRKPRVFYIGLPVRIRRLSAFWTRAIALEQI